MKLHEIEPDMEAVRNKFRETIAYWPPEYIDDNDMLDKLIGEIIDEAFTDFMEHELVEPK